MDKDLLARQEVRDFCEAAQEAQHHFSEATQAQVDQVCAAMVKAGFRASRKLADLAVTSTRMGNVEDKTLKNEFSTRDLWDFVRDMKTVGVIAQDRRHKVSVIAEPMGLIAGIIPVTNPTSTAMYKAIISVKSRNALVVSPHPFAGKCTAEAIRIMAEAAIKAGAPERLISCLSIPSNETAKELMRNPSVNLIMATGGKGIVQAAHSSGKPVIGVGPGNVPAFIEKSADVRKAVRDVIIGKKFDYGLICSAENALIVDRSIEKRVSEALREEKAAWIRGAERESLEKYMVTQAGALNPRVVGRSPQRIAAMAGFEIPEDAPVMIVEQEGVGDDYPLSREKLSPVLAYYTVGSTEEGIALAASIVDYGGKGHTAVIHSTDEDAVSQFSRRTGAFRILVNTPAPHGSVGYTTGLDPALSLGSGTWGGSITSDNITPLHLINRKRVGWETESVGPGGIKGASKSRRGSYSRYDDQPVQKQPAKSVSVDSTERTETVDLEKLDRIAEDFTRSLQTKESSEQTKKTG
ncbi:MAG: aldehyde dehydrogenase family protein [Fidelibacterota bacterium]|nr:MAG: aldehyde dehydrogenase family protein [Candidatus Neomarinimicrobiota bacterium]